MIEEKQGKARSRRTKEEAQKILDKELGTLSPGEKETLQLLLAELADNHASKGDNCLIDFLEEAEYKWEPVDLRTFVLDPYFLGKTCGNTYPRLMEDLEELFAGGYHEAILTGSIGWGKTYFASIGVCRVIYELSCMKSPQRSYGLAPDTTISIVNLSVSEDLARKVVLENIASKLRESPYFKENFQYQETKKELRFPNSLWLAARSSTDTSVIGLNTICAVIDESNFMSKSQQQKASHARWGHYDRAENLYNAIKRRMKSRFERFGRLPGMLFIVSSKRTVDDFTARRVREATDDATVFVRDYATWDVRPEGCFSEKPFWVLCGNDQVRSRIVADDDLENVRKNMVEGTVLVPVPEEFKADFERDLEGAIRDIAGVATVAVSPYIQRREKITEAIDVSRKHPFTVQVLDPSRPGSFVWPEMVKEVRDRNYGVEARRLAPILNPRAARHVHIDPSFRKDATGFCMAHVAGWRDVPRRTEDGRQFMERAPVYVVDAILKVIPPTGGELVLADIRSMVYDLSAHGYTITNVSIDSWQSVDPIQQLQRKGYNAHVLSVDTRIDPYENLKTALYENRVFYYNYPPLLQELVQIEFHWEKRKVDHPANGSKDVADALAGCLYTLSTASVSQPMPILRGDGTQSDAWMEEQRHAMMAGDQDAGSNADVLPPFLTGSSDDGWGGGWSNF